MYNFRTLMSRFLPQKCVLCSHTLHASEDVICHFCENYLELSEDYCLFCYRPLPVFPPIYCGGCQMKKDTYPIIAGSFHQSYLGLKVHQIKDQQQFHWFYPLVRSIQNKYMNLLKKGYINPVEALLPVPLERAKLRQRGFNQSYILAKILSNTLKIPVINDCCFKIRETSSQRSLNLSERAKNLKGAFTARYQVSEQHIALIDDVYTTGATAHAVMQTLPRVRWQVWCLTKA